jgi:hypothetical protein
VQPAVLFFSTCIETAKFVCELAEWPGWVQDGKLIAPVIEELKGVA